MSLSIRSPTAELAAGLLLMAVLVGCGFLLGRNSRDDEVATSAQDTGRALQRAEGAEATVAEFKAKAKAELSKRLAQQSLAVTELAARDQRIAELTEAAGRRQKTIKQEAKADEDCAALRTTPVCAAIAHRVWGPAPADPH